MIKAAAALSVVAAALVGHADAACSAAGTGDCTKCNNKDAADDDCVWCEAQFEVGATPAITKLKVGVCAAGTCPTDAAVAFPGLAALYTGTDLTFSLDDTAPLDECDPASGIDSLPMVETSGGCTTGSFCYGYLTETGGTDTSEGGLCSAESNCDTALPQPAGFDILVGSDTTTTSTVAASSVAASSVDASSVDASSVDASSVDASTVDGSASTADDATTEAVHACTSTHATCLACAADAGCDWCQPQLSYEVANGSPSETLIKNYGGCYEAGTCPSVAFTSIEETFDVPSGTNAAGNAAEMAAMTVRVPTGNTCTADVTYSPYETCVACKDAGFEWCRVQVWIGAEEGEVDNVGSMCHAKCSDLAGSFTEDPTVKTDSAACSDGAFTTKTASLGVAAVVAAAALFAAA